MIKGQVLRIERRNYRIEKSEFRDRDSEVMIVHAMSGSVWSARESL